MRGDLVTPFDVYAPAAPGSLMRSYQLFDAGVFRLSRRDCSFYSVMIAAAGSFGRIVIKDGEGRPLFAQPSTFTGSFVLDAFAKGGLIVEAHMSTAPFLTINWREADREIV